MDLTDNSRLQRLALNDEGFAFDPQTGESFTINKVGQEILTQMIRGNSFEVISVEMSARYQQEERTVSSDLQDYVQQLRSLGLVGVSA